MNQYYTCYGIWLSLQQLWDNNCPTSTFQWLITQDNITSCDINKDKKLSKICHGPDSRFSNNDKEMTVKQQAKLLAKANKECFYFIRKRYYAKDSYLESKRKPKDKRLLKESKFTWWQKRPKTIITWSYS